MFKHFYDDLQTRKLIQDVTGNIEQIFPQNIIGYVGIDPTAPSLHLGNLATLMLLSRLQQTGSTPILVVGGFTGMIGDPSGKTDERKFLSAEELQYNVSQINAQLQSQLADLISFDKKKENAALLLNNYDWFKDISLLDFLRNTGKLITINYMIAKDSVQRRLETGISFTEFTYQLIQAYDFYHLYQHYGCKLQMGGSDQWGNITAGTELIRKKLQTEAHGLTTPLLTKSDGSKFGKTEHGNIWLSADRTSPYQLYQFLLNSADEDLARLFNVFSLKTTPEIDDLLAAHQAAPHRRTGQIALAAELTARIHGNAALEKAQKATETLFGNQPIEVLNQFNIEELHDIFTGIPKGHISKSEFESGITLLDLLTKSNAVTSKSEARKLIKSNGIKINKHKAEDENALISMDQLIHGKFILISKGKKNYHLAELQ